jgi:hypothetical protein
MITIKGPKGDNYKKRSRTKRVNKMIMVDIKNNQL